MKTITINKQKFPFRITVSSLAKLEIETGYKVSEIDKMGEFQLILALLPIAINTGYRKLQESQTVTREQIEDLIDEDPSCITTIGELIASEMSEAVGMVNGETVEDEKK